MLKTLGPFTLQDAGPWTRIAIVDERQTEICDGPPEQREALTLMAAAPELLAACKLALNGRGVISELASIRAAIEKAGG